MGNWAFSMRQFGRTAMKELAGLNWRIRAVDDKIEARLSLDVRCSEPKPAMYSRHLWLANGAQRVTIGSTAVRIANTYHNLVLEGAAPAAAGVWPT